MNWYVYIIETEDHYYYTGISTDVDRRFNQHLNGNGAKFFAGRKPLQVVYSEGGHTRSSATIREIEIKRLSHTEKERLCIESTKYDYI